MSVMRIAAIILLFQATLTLQQQHLRSHSLGFDGAGRGLQHRLGFAQSRSLLRPLDIRTIRPLPWPDGNGDRGVSFNRAPSRRVTWAGDSDSIDLSTRGGPRRPANKWSNPIPGIPGASLWPSSPLFSAPKSLMSALGLQLTPPRRRAKPWRRQPPRQPTISERVAAWFDEFKPPSDFLRVGDKRKRKKSKKPDRVHSLSGAPSLDYTDYQTGNDHNLIFHDLPEETTEAAESAYDFGDVFDSLQRNETQTETLRKFLSAASALSDRSSSSPAFMLWTIPTTIFATLGVVYFLAAAAILSYQALVGNGSQIALGPTVLALSLPAFVAFALVTARSSYKGELNIKRAMGGGGFRSLMRPDFDGVDFALDALFGSAAILGIGWIASITL